MITHIWSGLVQLIAEGIMKGERATHKPRYTYVEQVVKGVGTINIRRLEDHV